MPARRRRMRERPNHVHLGYRPDPQKVRELIDSGKRVEIALNQRPDAPSITICTVAWIEENDPEWVNRNEPDYAE